MVVRSIHLYKRMVREGRAFERLQGAGEVAGCRGGCRVQGVTVGLW